MVLLPTFRLPTLIHTRSGNAKWLKEISHTNPLWVHPRDAEGTFLFRHRESVSAFESTDPDTSRVWWQETGVNQNMTFPVQPDPVSGMHCWHQRVVVERAHPEDCYADIFVDTRKSREVYREWLARTKPAPGPDNLRRPLWLNRPLHPARSAYRL